MMIGECVRLCVNGLKLLIGDPIHVMDEINESIKRMNLDPLLIS